MAETTTFIKIDRNILRWGWYKKLGTFKLFIHLLLTANIKDCKFEKIVVHRGQLVASRGHLAQETGLSIQQVRTALDNLKSTNEITISTSRNYHLITVLNYDLYQKVTKQLTDNQPINNQCLTDNQPQSKNNKNISKDIKNKKKSASPPALSAEARALGMTDEELEAHIYELRHQ